MHNGRGLRRGRPRTGPGDRCATGATQRDEKGAACGHGQRGISQKMIGKAIKVFILVTGVTLIVFPLVEYVREATKLVTLSHAGQVKSDFERLGSDSAVVFSEVETLDFAARPYPSVGDTVVAVVDSLGSSSMSPQDWLSLPEPPGSRMRIVLAHPRNQAGASAPTRESDGSGAARTSEGQTDASARDTTTVILSPVPRSTVWLVAGIDVVRVLIHIGYLLVGFWAFSRRPDSPGVRALTLFSFSMATLMTIGVRTVPETYAAFSIPLVRHIRDALNSFATYFGVFWLNLAFLFPQPVRWIAGRMRRFHILLYFVPLSVTALDLAGVPLPAWIQWAVIVVPISAGFVVLGVRRGKARDPLSRRQLTLVGYGTGIGMGSLLMLILLSAVPAIAAHLSQLIATLMMCVGFLGLLLSPASFAYAFGRYRLLEVEGRLRRGTRFAFVTIVVLAVFLGGLFALSHLFLNVLRVESRTPALAIAMGLALAFVPVLRRTQGLVERRFYPERTRLKGLVSELLSASTAMPDRRSFWEAFETRLRDELGAERLMPLVANEGQESLSEPDGARTPFTRASAVVQEMMRTGSAVMVDEARASERGLLSDAEDAWLKERRVSLLLPMSVRGEFVGLLALVLREGREDLRGEELALLVSAAAQIALQSENLRLLEENIQKRHFEEQLAIARRVQERFLPSDLPPTPGLDVAARCIFSLEVAGDYYDVIRLDERRTLIAIGDVSGKGAGAAMIMANMQASLRALSGADIDLARAVERLNDVIRGNTELGQFITFFAAIYDPADQRLDYVNAGHNPPRIARANGEIETLDAGGPILGVLPGIRFEQGTCRLTAGDLLVAFTDGVTEAFDSAGEEFGEPRLAAMMACERTRPVSELVDLVQEKVVHHTGSTSFADDFTIVIARVLDGGGAGA